MGTCFAVTLGNGISDATNAQKNEKLLFCVGSGETALRARQGEIFEESASHHNLKSVPPPKLPNDSEFKPPNGQKTEKS